MGYGLKTDGSVHAHQVKSLDWETRKARKLEQAPPDLVSQVLDRLMAVLEDD